MNDSVTKATIEDYEAQARKYEMMAQYMRLKASRQANKDRMAQENEFRRTVGDIGVADDYAVVRVADWKFYYGYEYTLPEFPAEGEWREWAFVAWHQGVEVCRIPASRLHWDEKEDPSVMLLVGIMHLFNDDLIDRVECRR